MSDHIEDDERDDDIEDMGVPLPEDIEARRVEIKRRIEAGETIPLRTTPSESSPVIFTAPRTTKCRGFSINEGLSDGEQARS
ncbi:MAG: hypothetical protein M3552_15110 [Planctomycetota bacterium]|nr:hypothetical protein [Planctomycetota bacterium]